MLGVVFLSEYNELIHAFGNGEFRDHFTTKTAHNPFENADASIEYDTTAVETVRPTSSSSSGISSSTSTTCSSPSTASTKENDSKTARKKGKGGEENGKTEGRSDTFFGAKDEQRRQLDESMLLQQLMPLVLLCRAKQHQHDGERETNRRGTLSSLNENIESISCPNSLLQIRISSLPHSNLLVLIHGRSVALPSSSSSFVVDRLFPSLLRCIRYHYGGPSLQLIPLRSTFVRLLNMRCEQRMLRILSGMPLVDDDDASLCQNANFGAPSRLIRHSLLPLFKEIARQFAARIGRRCRYLFLHSNRLIASISSHNGERTAAAFCHDDLRSLLQFARQSPPSVDEEEQQQGKDKRKNSGRKSSKAKDEEEKWGRKSHAELGIWLYSKSCRRRQLHNVFVFSLDKRCEMICTAPTEYSQLISTIWEALDSVDKLTDNLSEHLSSFSESNVASLLERCDRLLANEQKLLDLLTNNGTAKRNKMKVTAAFAENGQKMAQQFPFLENVPRTQRLIRHHWNKLRESVNSLSSADPRVQSVHPPTSVVVPNRSPDHRPPSTLLLPFPRVRSPVAVSQRPSIFMPRLLSRCASNNQCTVSSNSSTVAPPLTHSSAAFSSTSFSSSRVSSTFLEAMRSQLRRVQRSLLDELLGWNAFRARVQTLSSLQTTVNRLMDSQMAAALVKLDAELCAANASIDCRSSLKPTFLGFDMIAYKCIRVGSPSLSLHYVPKEKDATQMHNKLMFMDDLDTEEPSNDHEEEEEIEDAIAEEITFARTSEGELLIRLCHPDTENPTTFKSADRSPKTVSTCVPLPSFALPSSILAALTAPLTSRFGKISRDFLVGQSVNTSAASYRCTVLFSHHTNTSLAIRQTSALIAKLRMEMEKNIVPNFY